MWIIKYISYGRFEHVLWVDTDPKAWEVMEGLKQLKHVTKLEMERSKNERI